MQASAVEDQRVLDERFGVRLARKLVGRAVSAHRLQEPDRRGVVCAFIAASYPGGQATKSRKRRQRGARRASLSSQTAG